jgi:hypothetical protein
MCRIWKYKWEKPIAEHLDSYEHRAAFLVGRDNYGRPLFYFYKRMPTGHLQVRERRGIAVAPPVTPPSALR